MTEGQARFAQVVKQADRELVTIERHGAAVAYVIGRARMEAITETMELLANPAAMRALRAAKAGRTRYTPLDKLPD